MVGLAVHEACAGSEHTVPASEHDPTVPSTVPAAKTLFCGLRDVESNSMDQFTTAFPPSEPKFEQTAPAGAPEGHATVATGVLAGPGTAGGTAGVPTLNAAVPETVFAGRVSTRVTLLIVPTPVFVTVPLNV